MFKIKNLLCISLLSIFISLSECSANNQYNRYPDIQCSAQQIADDLAKFKNHGEFYKEYGNKLIETYGLVMKKDSIRFGNNKPMRAIILAMGLCKDKLHCKGELHQVYLCFSENDNTFDTLNVGDYILVRGYVLSLFFTLNMDAHFKDFEIIDKNLSPDIHTSSDKICQDAINYSYNDFKTKYINKVVRVSGRLWKTNVGDNGELILGFFPFFKDESSKSCSMVIAYILDEQNKIKASRLKEGDIMTVQGILRNINPTSTGNGQVTYIWPAKLFL